MMKYKKPLFTATIICESHQHSIQHSKQDSSHLIFILKKVENWNKINMKSREVLNMHKHSTHQIHLTARTHLNSE